jgi:catechol 2,3-dioxygenase-like lactoylglutathione lyase family enzyme
METQGANTVQALKAHLALNVRDVERSIHFYRQMFGVEPSKVRTGYAKFDVQNPPLNFTLNQVPFGERGAHSHLGIQVGSTEDVLAVRGQWQEAGLAPRDEMKTDCCYAVQDKAWVSDPDGNSWEVFVVLEDNLPEKQTGGVCCAPVATEKAESAAASCGCSDTVGITR